MALALALKDVIWVISAVVALLSGLRGAFSFARSAGRDTTAGLDIAQAGPWGPEAFTRGYAAARGLRLEDADAFRHHLPSPVAGRPLRAMHGDLGRGVSGHAALWLDTVGGKYYVIAVAAAPAGDPAPHLAVGRGTC